MDEEVDVSFANCHEHSLHGFLEEQFDSVLEKLQLEQPCHGKRMIEKFEGFHGPIVEYMEKLCIRNGGLCVYNKEHVLCHNFLPLYPSFMFFIKQEDKFGLCDHLLDWIHWNSKIT